MVRALLISNYIRQQVKELKLELEKEGIDVNKFSTYELARKVIESNKIHLPKITEELYQSLKTRFPGELERISSEREFFDSRLMKYWKKPLQMLEAFQDYVQFLALEHHQKYTEEIVQIQDFKFEALSSLHARACLVTKEILCLLKNGFADGAHGRWRTLHDIVVVMAFLAQKAQITSEMYLVHQVIQEHRAVIQHNTHYKELNKRLKGANFKPTTETYLKELELKKDLLCKNMVKTSLQNMDGLRRQYNPIIPNTNQILLTLRRRLV